MMLSLPLKMLSYRDLYRAQLRLAKYNVALTSVLTHNLARSYFERHVSREYAEENLAFYDAAKAFHEKYSKFPSLAYRGPATPTPVTTTTPTVVISASESVVSTLPHGSSNSSRAVEPPSPGAVKPTTAAAPVVVTPSHGRTPSNVDGTLTFAPHLRPVAEGDVSTSQLNELSSAQFDAAAADNHSDSASSASNRNTVYLSLPGACDSDTPDQSKRNTARSSDGHGMTALLHSIANRTQMNNGALLPPLPPLFAGPLLDRFHSSPKANKVGAESSPNLLQSAVSDDSILEPSSGAEVSTVGPLPNITLNALARFPPFRHVPDVNLLSQNRGAATTAGSDEKVAASVSPNAKDAASAELASGPSTAQPQTVLHQMHGGSAASHNPARRSNKLAAMLGPRADMLRDAKDIFDRFVSDDAERQVNLKSGTRKALLAAFANDLVRSFAFTLCAHSCLMGLQTSQLNGVIVHGIVSIGQAGVHASTFIVPQKEILTLMETDSYMRFKQVCSIA